jgi:hypothetical protein
LVSTCGEDLHHEEESSYADPTYRPSASNPLIDFFAKSCLPLLSLNVVTKLKADLSVTKPAKASAKIFTYLDKIQSIIC